MESGLYTGKIYHQRVHPTQHAFTYSMALFWLKLSELDALDASLRGFSLHRFAPYWFRVTDYFKGASIQSHSELADATKQKMRELGSAPVNGDIFFLGQIRALGVFFSPVNFYFHRADDAQQFDYMLAEVSNTPWNQRHYYLVDLQQQQDTQKAFHVSPFNPIDMTYKWRVKQPDDKLAVALECHQQQRHFTASIAMQKQALDQATLNRFMLRMPSTTLFSLVGIYWQALKLFLKRTPIYGHPGAAQPNGQEKNNVAK